MNKKRNSASLNNSVLCTQNKRNLTNKGAKYDFLCLRWKGNMLYMKMVFYNPAYLYLECIKSWKWYMKWTNYDMATYLIFVILLQKIFIIRIYLS